MRTLLLLTVSALSLNPCSKEEGGADPAASGTAATAKPAADGPAVNEKSITRYPTERKVDETATTLREFDLRQSPPTGAVVTHLPAGTSVKKIATMPGSALVTYVAPNGEKTMGWLGDQAFEVMPDTPTPPTPGLPVIVNRDAGAGGAKDAGGGTALVDAGAPPAAATPKRKAVNGKCDPGWVVFPTGSDTCRQTCTSDASCGNPGLKCLPKGSQKLCATPQG